MRKSVRESVSRVVRRARTHAGTSNKLLVIRNAGRRRGLFERSVPPHPACPYRVTYTRDARGEWKIDGSRVGVTHPDKHARVLVCFLPANWPIGARLRRTVEAVRHGR